MMRFWKNPRNKEAVDEALAAKIQAQLDLEDAQEKLSRAGKQEQELKEIEKRNNISEALIFAFIRGRTS